MRRARFQIKPNLCPRGGPRSQSSGDAASKPKPATSAQHPSSATASADDAASKKDNSIALNAAQNEPAEVREFETSESETLVKTAQTASHQPTAEGPVSDKFSAGSKSPRKSAAGSHVAASRGRGDGSEDLTQLNPNRSRSPRKCSQPGEIASPLSPSTSQSPRKSTHSVLMYQSIPDEVECVPVLSPSGAQSPRKSSRSLKFSQGTSDRVVPVPSPRAAHSSNVSILGSPRSTPAVEPSSPNKQILTNSESSPLKLKKSNKNDVAESSVPDSAASAEPIGQNSTQHGHGDSSDKGSADSSATKPVKKAPAFRGMRSRFAKVRPNLAEAGKRDRRKCSQPGEIASPLSPSTSQSPRKSTHSVLMYQSIPDEVECVPVLSPSGAQSPRKSSRSLKFSQGTSDRVVPVPSPRAAHSSNVSILGSPRSTPAVEPSSEVSSPNKHILTNSESSPLKTSNDVAESLVPDSAASAEPIGQNSTQHGHGDSSDKGSADSSATKPVKKAPVFRGMRSRFAKVRPNLAEAGKRDRRRQPAKEIPEPQTAKEVVPEPQPQAENSVGDAGRNDELTASAAEASSAITDHEEVAFVEPQTVQDEEQLSQRGSEAVEVEAVSLEDVHVPSCSTQVAEMSPVVEDHVEESSDVNLSSSVPPSVNRDVSEEMEEGELMEADWLAAAEDSKKKPEEKKVRHVKPPLPSTEAQADRCRMKVSDLIYWNPSRNHMKAKESKASVVADGDSSKQEDDSLSVAGSVADVADGGEDEASNDSDALPVPQLKIGPDGNIILNMDSLVMDNTTVEAPMEVVEEDDDRFITCNSFRKNRHQKRWTPSETARFFKALSMVGTDFTMMCVLFPNRSRRDLKNKFTKEEKHNRPLVDKALRERQVFDRKMFEKAKEEEEEEKRKQEAAEEAKKTKKRKYQKREKNKRTLAKEDGDAEGIEGEEEEVEQRLNQQEREERKENNLKRRNAKLAHDGREFKPYKRAKTTPPAAEDAEEVVEILMNMSRGGKASSTKSSRDEAVSHRLQRQAHPRNYSFSASEDTDQDTSGVFVPRTVLSRIPPHSLQRQTSENVIIDSEVLLPETHCVQDVSSEAKCNCFVDPQADTGDCKAGCTCQEPAESATAVSASEANSVQSNHSFTLQSEQAPPVVTMTNTLPPAAAATTVSLPPSSGLTVDGRQDLSADAPSDQSSMLDITQVIEGLQAQASTPVDVVLVEQQVEGCEQGLVHVYLVPRTNAPEAENGGEGVNLSNCEGGQLNSLQSAEGVGNSVVLEGGELNSRQSAEGVGNSVVLEGGELNSRQSAEGVGNSVVLQGGELNSLQSAEGVGNSVVLQGGELNSLQSAEGVWNSVVLQGGELNSLQSAEGVGNSVVLQGGELNSRQSAEGVGNSVVLQGGELNSLQSAEGVGNSGVLEGGELKSLQSAEGAGNGVGLEGGELNSLQSVEGFGNGVVLEGGDSNSQHGVEVGGSTVVLDGGQEDSLQSSDYGRNSGVLEGGDSTASVEESSRLQTGSCENMMHIQVTQTASLSGGTEPGELGKSDTSHHQEGSS